MTNNLEDEIRAIVARMDNQESQDSTKPPQEEIQDVYVLIVREQEEDQTQVVDSTPLVPHNPQLPPCSKTHFFPRMCLCVSHCFLFLPHLSFQLYCMMNPLIATVTIIPQIPTSNTFRHDAARQSVTTTNDIPITNHTSNRKRPPGRESSNRNRDIL